VSLARSTRQGGRISLILAFVFPAMIAAALALAFLGYQGAQNLVGTYQKNFNTGAELEAREVAEFLTQNMDGVVNRLFQTLGDAIEDPLLADSGKCAAELHPLIGVFTILHQSPDQKAVCVAPQARKASIEKQIRTHVTQLQWGTVPTGTLKYVHVGTNALFAVTRYVAVDGQAYFMLAQLNVDFILSAWLDLPVRKLGQLYRVALVDENGREIKDKVFGGSAPLANERFVYDEPLGRHLYAFNLRLGPNEETRQSFEEGMARDRVLRPVLLVLSTTIIVFGMTLVLLSVLTERRASRLKSDFIANVSHELKTPLSLIRMFGEMVATGRHKGEETAREYGGIITRESERLSHLIDNVLDFARLERGKASYDFAEGELAPVLERALDVCRYRLEKEKLKLRTRVERNLPLVRMDENAMTLVILNLVDNAVKYGPEGGVVEVALDRVPGGVALSVRDWGPGIPVDEQLRIFERFYRAQSARDRNVRGSGIGLALVRHIAEAHGGHVSVESPVPPVRGGGVGSLFRVYLPAAVEMNVETPDGPAQAAKS
jgi:signal transduction histidine kinase